jgi:hypothetical protein
MLRRASIAVIAFATAGSALFGGVALAGDAKDGEDRKDDKKIVKVHNTGGNAEVDDVSQACEINQANVFTTEGLWESAIGDVSQTNTATCTQTVSATGGAGAVLPAES